MRLQEKVGHFLAGQAPQAICDACLAHHLALKQGQASAAAGRARNRRGLKRFKGRCWGCCTTRTVTIAATA
jgi:hypothetical protein